MRVVRNVSESEWWSWIENREEVSFFQTPLWAQVLVDSIPGLAVETRFYEFADGARALVPLVRRRRLGGLLSSLESMPFGTYGGFVSDRRLARDELLQVLADLRRAARTVGRLIITPDPLGTHGFPEDVFREHNFVHFLPLDEGYDTIWKRRFNRDQRASVRKSIRRGVVAELAADAGDFDAFAALYAITARGWERPTPFGDRFFTRLAGLDQRHVKLWVARFEGRMVAGLLLFTYDQHQTAYMTAFDRDYRTLLPNNLLIAEATRWAARHGLRYFNFLSSGGIKGVEHFKSSFGTQRVFFNFYREEHVALRWLRALRR